MLGSADSRLLLELWPGGEVEKQEVLNVPLAAPSVSTSPSSRWSLLGCYAWPTGRSDDFPTLPPNDAGERSEAPLACPPQWCEGHLTTNCRSPAS